MVWNYFVCFSVCLMLLWQILYRIACQLIYFSFLNIFFFSYSHCAHEISSFMLVKIASIHEVRVVLIAIQKSYEINFNFLLRSICACSKASKFTLPENSGNLNKKSTLLTWWKFMTTRSLLIWRNPKPFNYNILITSFMSFPAVVLLWIFPLLEAEEYAL